MVIIIIIIIIIIDMAKLLYSDCLRREWKVSNTSAEKCNTSAKSVIQCKLHIEILDYDWLMNNRVWSRPIKFAFKSSACPGWCNWWLKFPWLHDTGAFLLLHNLKIFSCILLISNHMIFLMQFGINKHL